VAFLSCLSLLGIVNPKAYTHLCLFTRIKPASLDAHIVGNFFSKEFEGGQLAPPDYSLSFPWMSSKIQNSREFDDM
jgi:hypothetical protein